MTFIERPDIDRGKLFSLKECAGILHVTRQTLLRYRNLGLISFKKGILGSMSVTGAEIMRCWEALYDRKTESLK